MDDVSKNSGPWKLTAEEEKVRTALLDLYEELYAERTDKNWNQKLKASSLMNNRVGEAGIDPYPRHDSTVLGFLDTLVNGMVSAIMPEADYWFKFTTWGANTAMRGEKSARGRQRNGRSRSVENGGEWKPDLVLLDDIDGAKDYFEDSSQKILSHFSHAKFYRSMETVIRDGLCMGFGVIQTVDDVEHDRCYFKAISPVEVCAKADDSGDIEIYARRYYMSALSFLLRYGRSIEGDSSRMNAQTQYEMTEFIVPKGLLRDYQTGESFTKVDRDNKGKPKKSYDHYVYCRELDAFVERGVFAEMPISVWNYKQVNGSVYGTGLFEQIVPEILNLDNLMLERARSLAYSNDPAWQVTPNAARHFSVKSGSVNVVSSAAGQSSGGEIQAIQKPEVYDKYTADIQDLRMQIRELCYIDLYKTVLGSTDTRKTATEINISKTEASQLLTATIGNLQATVTHIVKRTFNVLRRRGDIAPPSNEQITSLFPYVRVEFDSVFIQRMRSYYMVEGNMSILNMVQILAAVYPDIRYTINFDRLVRMLSTGLGVSEYAIYETKESDRMRQEAAKAAQAQLQLQNENMASQTGMNQAKAQQALANAGGANA